MYVIKFKLHAELTLNSASLSSRELKKEDGIEREVVQGLLSF